MVTLTVLSKELDPEVLIDAVRTLFVSTSEILTQVLTSGDDPRLARITNGPPKVGTPAPFIVLSLVEPVMNSTYANPMVNTLLDVGVYTDGWDTTPVRSLTLLCLRALLGPWTAVNMQINSCSIEGIGAGWRNADEVLPGGLMRRGRQFTVRIIATKIA